MLIHLTSSAARLACRWVYLALAAFLVLMSAPRCAGERPTATAVATDRAALPASNKFSMPTQDFGLSDAGDVFFSTGGPTALFRWRQATGAHQRLLQTNDPIEALGLDIPPEDAEEVAGALLDSTGALLQVNAAGHAAFALSLALKEEQDPAAVFVYDGNSYRLVNVGLNTFSRLLLNVGGRVAALGNAGALGGFPMQIDVETASGVVMTVAEQGRPTPIGGTYNSLQLIGFNNLGQAAFLADIQTSPSSTTRAVFLAVPPYQAADIKLVVRSGGPVPGGGTFNLVTGTGNYALNNLGKVAFASNVNSGLPGIWIGSGSADPVELVRQGGATVVTPPGGNYSSAFTLRGFNDPGQVLFNASVSGGTSNHALFLKAQGDTARVVFYRGQPGGPGGGAFDTTMQASLNNAGKVALLVRNSSFLPGWYLGSGTMPPQAIAVQGDTTPIGGSFGLAGRNVQARLSDSNQVLFIADILELNAVGLFVWREGNVRSVVTSRDSLPRGANTVLRAELPSASDTEVLVRVRKAGGQATWYAKPLETGMIGLRKIVAEFDQVPDAGTVANPTRFSMNGTGEVVFTAVLLNSDSYPLSGILGSLPASGLEKAILVGDDAPGGGTFSSFGQPQLNNRTQVAFYATTTIGTSTGQGIFIASKDPPSCEAVARVGDAWPDGSGNFNGFATNVVLNDSGQVAFQGNRSGGSGLFVGTDGGPLAKVVKTGDPAPGGGAVNSVQGAFKLNAAGQVAYVAGLTAGSKSRGVFLGTPSTTEYARQPIALAPDPAPGTGGATFRDFHFDSIDLNSSGQVAFYSWLDGLVWHGWFLGSTGAPPAPRLLPNQPLPGGGHVEQAPAAARVVALANSGEMAIYVYGTSETDFQPQIVIAGVDGTLRKFARNGEKAEGTGSDFGKLYLPMVATPSGKFLFGAMLLNGPAKAGIFIDKP